MYNNFYIFWVTKDRSIMQAFWSHPRFYGYLPIIDLTRVPLILRGTPHHTERKNTRR